MKKLCQRLKNFGKGLLATGGLVALIALNGCTPAHTARKKDLADLATAIKGEPISCEMVAARHNTSTDAAKNEKDVALSAYQAFTYLIEHIMKSKEGECYSSIDSIKENLGGYKIRIKRSLAKDEENYLSISLFKEKKRQLDALNLFPKEELIKKSLLYTEKGKVSAVDTGYFIEGGAIQTAGMVLEIKEGRLIATPDIYMAKEIENPVLFKKELVTPTYRHKIVGFISKSAKEESVKK